MGGFQADFTVTPGMGIIIFNFLDFSITVPVSTLGKILKHFVELKQGIQSE